MSDYLPSLHQHQSNTRNKNDIMATPSIFFQQTLTQNNLGTILNQKLKSCITLTNLNILAQTVLWSAAIAFTFHPFGFLINVAVATVWAVVDTTVEVIKKHNAMKATYIKTHQKNDINTDRKIVAPYKTNYRELAQTIGKSLAKNVMINAAYLVLPPVIKGLFRIAFAKVVNQFEGMIAAKARPQLPRYQSGILQSAGLFKYPSRVNTDSNAPKAMLMSA